MTVSRICFSLTMMWPSRWRICRCSGKEALEASGYGEDGYVRSYQIEKGDAFIMVGHKSSNMLSKTYHVAEDGEHIIVKE